MISNSVPERIFFRKAGIRFPIRLETRHFSDHALSVALPEPVQVAGDGEAVCCKLHFLFPA